MLLRAKCHFITVQRTSLCVYELKTNRSGKVIVYIYRVSRGKCAKLRENVPYVKVHRYNPKHLYPKLKGYGDNGERIFKV